jgi:hypothetical protein
MYNINKRGGSNMKDIEQIIREVNGTMSMEGMPITDEDKNRIRDCLRDKNKFDNTIKELILKHTVQPVNSNELRL